MVFTVEEGQLKIEGQKNRGVRWTTSPDHNSGVRRTTTVVRLNSGPLLVRLTPNRKFGSIMAWTLNRWT